MRRQSNMIFICCSKKTEFSRSGKKIMCLKSEKVRKTWCTRGALCGLWPGEHGGPTSGTGDWIEWQNILLTDLLTMVNLPVQALPSTNWICLAFFLKVKLNIWSPSISSASFRRLLLLDCRSEMIHLKAGRLNFVSNVWKMYETLQRTGCIFLWTLRWEKQHIFVRLFWKYILEDHILVERWVKGWTF